MSEDRFWLDDSDLVPAGAEAYEGPPPIPLDQLRAELPGGWITERARH